MGFFKLIRRKIKSKKQQKNGFDPYQAQQPQYYNHAPYQANGYPAKNYIKALPPNVLYNIFSQVCPHAQDESLASSEESMTEDGCMLCDMRDLAHCALVCTKWYQGAQQLLYQHIRIDAVHYCELEVELAAKRKKNSFLNHNAEPIDAPRTRLILLMRTVRETKGLGELVLSLRMPYMTRESSKSELARTVSVLPNLRYIDLPAGFYSDDASCVTLKQEVMGRCPNLRRMKYVRGSEATFSHIPHSHQWANLEVMELSRLNIEPNLLRLALSFFNNLQDLKMEDMQWLEDSAFKPASSLPMFPPLERLTLQDIPNVTSKGLVAYFSSPKHCNNLKHLSLVNTGVLPQTLQEILIRATGLHTLSVTQEVSRAFPTENPPALCSKSLRLLHYEITSENSAYGVQPLSSSYYTYLMTSLLGGNLPGLRDLYVRDSTFPEALMFAPPPRLYGGGENGPQAAQGGLNQMLSVYSKGMDELEWNFTTYEPLASGRRTSVTRPVSFHGAQLSPAWGGDARQSVLVGNGFGGFLAIPADERPSSSSSKRGFGGKKAQRDIWR